MTLGKGCFVWNTDLFHFQGGSLCKESGMFICRCLANLEMMDVDACQGERWSKHPWKTQGFCS